MSVPVRYVTDMAGMIAGKRESTMTTRAHLQWVARADASDHPAANELAAFSTVRVRDDAGNVVVLHFRKAGVAAGVAAAVNAGVMG